MGREESNFGEHGGDEFIGKQPGGKRKHGCCERDTATGSRKRRKDNQAGGHRPVGGMDWRQRMGCPQTGQRKDWTGMGRGRIEPGEVG